MTVVGIRDRILEAICNSIASAYLIFSVPGEDQSGGCFAVDKWTNDICPT